MSKIADRNRRLKRKAKPAKQKTQQKFVTGRLWGDNHRKRTCKQQKSLAEQHASLVRLLDKYTVMDDGIVMKTTCRGRVRHIFRQINRVKELMLEHGSSGSV